MGEIPDDIMKAAKACYENLPLSYDGWDVDAVITEIAKAILAERERSKWQTIDTAPKDGTKVLLFTRWEGDWVCEEAFEEAQIGFWQESELEWDTDLIGTATHWQPIPKPPEHQSSDAPPPKTS